MERLFAIVIVLGLAGSASAQTAIEKAEKRLVELLAPGASIPAVTFTMAPIAWKPSAAVVIDAPLKPFVGVTIRLPQAPVKEVKPRAVPDGRPLASFQDKSPKPKDVELATKPLIRLPSLDVHTPLPIPILANQQPDRASLGDPALQASLDAALKRLTPSRDRPVPFTPQNLPDPFEHVRTGQLRNPPDENPMPPAVPLQKPK
jgi:hypothetical protein